MHVALQHRIACQAEQIKDAVTLAPVHDAVSAETAVAAQHDADVGPFATEPLDQKLQDRSRVPSGIDVRRPQIGDEEMIAAMNVEGQETVVVVVAVEETLLLLAMNDVVGGIEIEDEFFGGLGMV